MSFAPLYLPEMNHDLLYCPASLKLGELHWYILKAANALENRGYIWVQTHGSLGGRHELTDLGKEVGGDEINWWLTKKESNPEDLRVRTTAVLDGVQRIKKGADTLKTKEFPSSYANLLSALRQFATEYAVEIDLLYKYIVWLEGRHELGPTILYTYRVWGTTRASDRWIDIEANDTITPEITKLCIEMVLGVRLGTFCTYDRVYLHMGQEINDAMSIEERQSGTEPIVVPLDAVVRRTANETYDACAVYFTEIRDSLRNILVDIEKLSEQQSLLHSSSFWKAFITKAVAVRMAEPRTWDFKETLSIWHAQGAGQATAKLDFAEHVAAFANARGGVLIVGVTDEPRRIVGVANGKELENRLQSAKTVLAQHLVDSGDIVTFKQVNVDFGGISKLCLVVVVAQSRTVVGVNDGTEKFVYPVRLETGRIRSAQSDIARSKRHIKSDNLDFISELLKFVRDH